MDRGGIEPPTPGFSVLVSVGAENCLGDGGVAVRGLVFWVMVTSGIVSLVVWSCLGRIPKRITIAKRWRRGSASRRAACASWWSRAGSRPAGSVRRWRLRKAQSANSSGRGDGIASGSKLAGGAGGGLGGRRKLAQCGRGGIAADQVQAWGARRAFGGGRRAITPRPAHDARPRRLLFWVSRPFVGGRSLVAGAIGGGPRRGVAPTARRLPIRKNRGSRLRGPARGTLATILAAG